MRVFPCTCVGLGVALASACPGCQANAAIRKAVAAEREACATVAEAFGVESHDDAPGVVRAIAAAIRNRVY